MTILSGQPPRDTSFTSASARARPGRFSVLTNHYTGLDTETGAELLTLSTPYKWSVDPTPEERELFGLALRKQ